MVATVTSLLEGSGSKTSLVTLAVLVIIGIVLSSGGDSRPDYPFSVQTFDDQGREHLEPGQT